MRLLLGSVLVLAVVAPAHAQLAPPNAAGITFGHVHVNVRDIEVHKKLWVEHFDGVVVQKGPLVAVKLPGMLIAFRQAAPTGGSQGTVMDHFGFKVRNLAEVLKAWRAAGYQVGREFIGSEGFPNAYLMGPDDIKIELQEDKVILGRITQQSRCLVGDVRMYSRSIVLGIHLEHGDVVAIHGSLRRAQAAQRNLAALPDDLGRDVAK